MKSNIHIITTLSNLQTFYFTKPINFDDFSFTGWPPRWVRRRSQSPSEDNLTNNSQNNKQRALPPVPIQQVGQLDEPETETTSHQNQNIEPDVELNRRITPEIRPEDFPPGVAYLPDGDDDDFDEEDFNSKSNNKIDFASTIKTVKNVRN